MVVPPIAQHFVYLLAHSVEMLGFAIEDMVDHGIVIAHSFDEQKDAVGVVFVEFAQE